MVSNLEYIQNLSWLTSHDKCTREKNLLPLFCDDSSVAVIFNRQPLTFQQKKKPRQTLSRHPPRSSANLHSYLPLSNPRYSCFLFLIYSFFFSLSLLKIAARAQKCNQLLCGTKSRCAKASCEPRVEEGGGEEEEGGGFLHPFQQPTPPPQPLKKINK